MNMVWYNSTRDQSVQTLRPLSKTTMLPSSSMIDSVTTVTAKATAGSTSRNACFREHGREIGNWQGLPEQNAAVAALAVQCVERIKDTDDEGRPHDQTHREVVRLGEHFALVRGVHRHRAAHGVWQAEEDEQEAEQNHAGDRDRGEIDGTVLPQFAPDRPVQRPGRGNTRNRLGRERRLGRAVRLGHRAAPWPCPACWPITATNKSAMLGLPTSPSAASSCRSTRSNSRMLRPNTCRSYIGRSARARAICSGFTVTSRYRDSNSSMLQSSTIRPRLMNMRSVSTSWISSA